MVRDNKEINNTTNSDEISLKGLILNIIEWWRYLWSKWIIILLSGIIGGAVGLMRAYSKKPLYTAKLNFTVQDEKSGGGLSGALGLASQFGLDLGGISAGGEFAGDNLLELMKSRSIIEKTLLSTVIINGKVETLAEYYISINKFRDDWKDKPELKHIYYLPNADRSKFNLKQDSLLETFYKSLIPGVVNVDKLDKKLTILSIKVVSGDQLFSKYFTEALAKVVSDYYVQTKTEKASKTVLILQRQTDSVRSALNSAISGVASSVDAAPNPNPSLQRLQVPSERRKVDVQANSAILTELVKNLELSKMSLLQSTPLIQIIDRPILPLEKTKPSRLYSVAGGGLLFSFLVAAFLVLKKRLADILK